MYKVREASQTDKRAATCTLEWDTGFGGGDQDDDYDCCSKKLRSRWFRWWLAPMSFSFMNTPLVSHPLNSYWDKFSYLQVFSKLFSGTCCSYEAESEDNALSLQVDQDLGNINRNNKNLNTFQSFEFSLCWHFFGNFCSSVMLERKFQDHVRWAQS